MTIHVFLGPTLSRDRAKEILPRAIYHPPVQCGDILRLLSLEKKPSTIVIIDGYYERSAAVWHKEILVALSQGCRVIGAASMGALRASELNYFGMEGVGEIFERFHSGEYEDDDEVAVLHAPKQSGYHPLNEAMVNVRETLKKAVREKIITTEEENQILGVAKKIFYPDRTWEVIFSGLDKDLASKVKWCQANTVNQKALDAVKALEYVKALPLVKADSKPMEMVQPSIFIRRLQKYANTSLRKTHHESLSDTEKSLSRFSKRYPASFHLLSELTYTLACMDDYVRLDQASHLNAAVHPCFESFQQDEKLALIAQWACGYLSQCPDIEKEFNKYQRWTTYLFSIDEAAHQFLIDQYSLLWLAIEWCMKSDPVNIARHEVEETIRDFAKRHQMEEINQLQSWVARQGLDEAEFSAFIISHAYADKVFKSNSYEALPFDKSIETIDWLTRYYRLHFVK